jgi:hypothetical protein
MTLFLDCDGVLANFDEGVKRLLGMTPQEYQKKYNLGRFWGKLASAQEFYATLPLMPDAMELFDAVKHLHPVILTGLPLGNWAAPQKVKWAAQHFPGTKIITCMAVDKRKHCSPRDILVDDTLKYKDLWEGAGGTFIHHKSAADTITHLKAFPELKIV